MCLNDTAKAAVVNETLMAGFFIIMDNTILYQLLHQLDFMEILKIRKYIKQRTGF